ncbi:glycosyltransferase family 2 protein [Flavobacterium sp. Fl-318]|jgi:hypothetical protein|uniref:Glycosyltransferase family 2 protein n=1 Tax=Flavobacterium cupriresistens TaxID=2893885 RepID=A0ABU4R6I1_9FLAO|nr:MULTISPECIES: glycosyltransferase family 2 protein [unclassified Flavobacterium]MDX6188194.1 glycosyltransferase family 2 protein [Flavobacterium sp. Fl-318]UFH40762.1 glycosyltransferase family 2 protein [Flavobacterium sp. F-323]
MLSSIPTPKISVIAFCTNEVNDIKKLIDNVSFAHEIILINTNKRNNAILPLVEKCGATLVQQTITNKTQQQNLLINQVQNDWILLLDLKEYISTELKNEILLKISNPQANRIYYIKQTFHFFKKKINYGEFIYRKRVFLFRKKVEISLSNNRNKPSIIAFFRKSEILKNRIDSYTYKDFDEYNLRLSLKSKEEAILLHMKNIKPNMYHFLLKPFFNFMNQYFAKLGFLDGKEGYILAYINSFAILKRYLFLWLLRNKLE